MSDISDLPDVILSHILSLLDAKSAVGTTLLSTRWKDLVGSSILHFNDSTSCKLPSLKDFVNKVLRRDKHFVVDKFLLISRRQRPNKLRENFIAYVGSLKGLRHLQLCMPKLAFDQIGLSNIVIPDSLTSLDLKVENWNNQSPVIDAVFGSSRLEILHLEGFRFAEQPNLLSKCEKLVELSMINCSLEYSPGKVDYKLILRAPQLVRLTISDFRFPSQDRVILLTLPNLSALFSFKASDAVPVIQTDEFVHLETASLELADRNRIGKHELVIDMLQKLCRAQHVTLSLPAFELLHPNRGPLGEEVLTLPFSNLKTLRITTEEENMSNNANLPCKRTIDQMLNIIT